MDFSTILERIQQFRDDRDWEQFHTPRNLTAALSIEAAELQEIFLWKTDSESTDYMTSDEGHSRISDEVADVLIYTLLFAETAKIDVQKAIIGKLKKNEEKYPVNLSKGKAAKYDELGGVSV